MKRLTLSFDNGPHRKVTPAVLEVLAEFQVQASFFVCGKDLAAEQRHLVECAKAAGHRIGNHTFSHSVELGISADPDVPSREIGAAQQALGDLAAPERWFRPYGAGGVLSPRLLSPAAVRFLCDGGYSCVLWNSVPRDWEAIMEWPGRALDAIQRQDWTLVVLHDVPTGAMRQLARFLALVSAAGVEVVSDFPPDCVPILRGQVVGDLTAICRTDS